MVRAVVGASTDRPQTCAYFTEVGPPFHRMAGRLLTDAGPAGERGETGVTVRVNPPFVNGLWR